MYRGMDDIDMYEDNNVDEQNQQNSQDEIIQQKQKSLKKLKIIQKILWLYQPKNQVDQKRIKVLLAAMKIIYGQNSVVHFDNEQSLTDFVIAKKLQGTKLYKLLNKQSQNNISLYLIICQQSNIQFFAKQLSWQKQVYHKCIVFKAGYNIKKIDKKSNCRRLKKYIRQVVNQVYDIHKCVDSLDKQLEQISILNYITMINNFNIVLDDETQNCIQYQCQKLQFWDSQDERHKQKNSQNNRGNQLMNKKDKIVQQVQIKVAKQLIQKFQSQIDCVFSPQQQRIGFITYDNLKEQLAKDNISTQNLKIVGISQLKNWIQQFENQPKIILCSQQLLPTNFDQHRNVYLIIRCQWGEQHLNEEQLSQFKSSAFYKHWQLQKQKNQNSKIIYANRDNFSQKIGEAQNNLQKLLQ